MMGFTPGLLYIDSTYLLLIVPVFVLSLVAQFYVRRMYTKFSQVRSARGITAEDAARRILDRNGCSTVTIEAVAGTLSDHFDPRTGTLRLSEATRTSSSVAAIGVAAHEAGHAIQHTERYLPNVLRAALVPAARIGSTIGPYIALAGIILTLPILLDIGIVLFAAALLFYLVTLPVELNASRRAMVQLEQNGILGSSELTGARRVLTAAALTYIASALVAFASLTRMILLSRGMRRR